MKKKSTKAKVLWILLISIILGTIACKDDKDADTSYDPTIPVTVTSFFPDKGSSGNQLLIFGSNFGNDTTQVKVTINDQKAVIISVSQSSIYCMVPPKAGNGAIKVNVGKKVNEQEAVSDAEFEYIPGFVVKTLAGWRDRDGNSHIADGTFDEAQFEEPYALLTDPKGENVYLLEQNRGLRVMSLKDRKVTTLFRAGNGMEQPRAFAFSTTSDTLYIFNDQDRTDDGVSILTTTRKDNFKQWNKLVGSKSCCGGDANPITGDIFFNQWQGGQYYKWNVKDQTKDFVFRVDNNFNSGIHFAPSGKFAYIVSMSQNCIYKVDYDIPTGKLGGLRILCGKKGDANHYDGPGSKARFDSPQQGVFDEENNFYVTDQGNHCIRKIEPNGQVTTFAGRPKEWGYVDGDLRKEARFDRPHGIAYNRLTKEFYVADRNNKRIRIITKE